MTKEYINDDTFTITRFRDGDTLEGFFTCSHCRVSHSECLRLPDIDSWEPAGNELARARRVAEQLTETYRGISGRFLGSARKRDKYNRLIGDILIGDFSLQQLIVNANLAWFGVGKPPPNGFPVTML